MKLCYTSLSLHYLLVYSSIYYSYNYPLFSLLQTSFRTLESLAFKCLIDLWDTIQTHFLKYAFLSLNQSFFFIFFKELGFHILYSVYPIYWTSNSLSTLSASAQQEHSMHLGILTVPTKRRTFHVTHAQYMMD